MSPFDQSVDKKPRKSLEKDYANILYHIPTELWTLYLIKIFSSSEKRDFQGDITTLK